MDKAKKAFEVAKQILRWIWKVILSTLFIAGVFFQTPLKLLLLILVFLLACTILPLRFRKWFWAAVGVVILIFVVWVFLPENDEGWKPFTFDKELAALEAKYKIPDEENAAIIYNQLVADYNKSEIEPNFITDQVDNIISSEYWLAKDYPEVAKWIKSHKETISKLMQASQFEKCKFDITSKTFLFFDINRTGAIRRWAQLLSKASNNDIAEGRTAKGLGKIYCTLNMGEHLYQQPLLVDILVGISVKSLAISHLNNFVITGSPNKKQLDKIEEFIGEIKYDWQSDLPRVLDYEKLFTKNMLSSMIYETNKNGEIRLSRNPENAVRSFMPAECNDIPSLPYLARKLSKASAVIKWLFVPSSPQELSKAIDLEYEKFYNMADPDFDWSKKPPEVKFSFLSYKLNYEYFLKLQSLLLSPSYYSIHGLYLRSDSSQRGALLLIALRRYKDKNRSWPKSLDDIKGLTDEENFIDPLNGQSFVYKLADGDFTLYSKGKNGEDDEGERFSEYCGGTNVKKTADDIYIWRLKNK
ncbi:MAG: hypothetical protein CVV39_00430 [Planctomycetes bacterium HGW-Planctomycetes-1]|nr:MAG: hypothetical protein CVV39_00430 [Planctomycetes bacterium HGW-Planctomycetes-1]